jgi:hypothetical protein
VYISSSHREEKKYTVYISSSRCEEKKYIVYMPFCSLREKLGALSRLRRTGSKAPALQNPLTQQPGNISLIQHSDTGQSKFPSSQNSPKLQGWSLASTATQSGDCAERFHPN